MSIQRFRGLALAVGLCSLVVGSAPLLAQGASQPASFLATDLSESPVVPPDPSGAAGPTQILVAVNGRIKVFDKAGHVGGLSVDTNTFFQSVLPDGSAGTTNPRIVYDRL